jgi:fructan beta-fructosidase
VSGHLGNGLVNTFLNGDTSVGTLTSPAFTLDKDHINLLIGGGDHPSGSEAPTAVARLRILVDLSSVEVIGGDGQTVITTRSSPTRTARGSSSSPKAAPST